MSRQVVVKNAAAAHLHCHEDEQHPESNCDGNQKVTGHNSRSVILDEGSPMLVRVSSWSPIPRVLRPILPHRSRRNIDTEFQGQFIGDALFSPGDVFLHHASDELADLLRQRPSTATRLASAADV